MSTRRRNSLHGLAVFVAFATSMLAPPAVGAQWVDGGLRLPGGDPPRVVSDGAGGAFFLTHHYASVGDDIDLRLVHLDAFGLPASGWTAAGLLVAETDTTESWIGGCRQPDGTITIEFSRRPYPRVGRIRQDGSVVPDWEPGIAPAIAPFARGRGPCATPDNGNFFLWQDEIGVGSGNYYDLLMQRFSASGQVAPGWPPEGKVVAGGPGDQELWARPLSDGGEGAWFAYHSVVPGSPVTDADVFVQHVDGLGEPMPGFPYGGINLCTLPGAQAQASICRDGDDGVFVAWADARSCPGTPTPDFFYCYDIYLQRIRFDGTLAPGWPANGLPVCVHPDQQQVPKLVPDGSGGVFVAWEYTGPQGYTIHAQHVLADGSIAPGWPVGGQRMFAADAYGDNMAACSDQLGGLFVAGSTWREPGQFRVYVQHVTGDGTFDGSWGRDGLPVGDPPPFYDEDDAEIVESLPGSAIVAWDSYGAYATRVSLEGIVATTVALVSADAHADHVALAWHAAGDPLASARVERRGDGEAWRLLAPVAPDGTGMVRYDDRDVAPGARYAYRLTWVEGSALRHTSEAWVVVPLLAKFALAGATPNPAPRGELRVAFSLAAPGDARLELFDVQGRTVAAHELPAAPAGPHLERLDAANALPGGLYWLRLTQGTERATARVVVVHR